MGCLIRALAVLAVTGVALGTLPGPSTHAAAWRLSQSADQSSDKSAPVTQDPSVPATQGAAPDKRPDHEDVTHAKTEDGTPATVIDDRDAEAILGKSVYSAASEDMGRIVDVIVKRNGEVRAAVIDFGGFLGVGSRKIAVDWSALRFPTSGPMDHINLELTRDQVRLAPEFKPGEPLVVLGSVGDVQPSPEPPAPER
jgi:PRC-barrel domain protein